MRGVNDEFEGDFLEAGREVNLLALQHVALPIGLSLFLIQSVYTCCNIKRL